MLVSGYSILKGSYPYFSSIKYPVSSIQYLANCGINDRFHDVVIFGSGLSGLEALKSTIQMANAQFITTLCINGVNNEK
jgi:hypothetical protein